MEIHVTSGADGVIIMKIRIDIIQLKDQNNQI